MQSGYVLSSEIKKKTYREYTNRPDYKQDIIVLYYKYNDMPVVFILFNICTNCTRMALFVKIYCELNTPYISKFSCRT